MFFFNLLMTIEIIASFLLCVVILMQSSKGGGLAGTFGGGSVGMVFGVRRTADFLTKGTQVLAVSFMVLALIINIWFLPRVESTGQSVIQRGAQERSTMSPQLPPSPPSDAGQQPATNPPPTSTPQQ